MSDATATDGTNPALNRVAERLEETIDSLAELYPEIQFSLIAHLPDMSPQILGDDRTVRGLSVELRFGAQWDYQIDDGRVYATKKPDKHPRNRGSRRSSREGLLSWMRGLAHHCQRSLN